MLVELSLSGQMKGDDLAIDTLQNVTNVKLLQFFCHTLSQTQTQKKKKTKIKQTQKHRSRVLSVW